MKVTFHNPMQTDHFLLVTEEDTKKQKRKNVKKLWFTQHVFSAQNVESVRGIAALTEVRYIIPKFFYR